ncbi:MAG: enoyl-CoA hydratase/isomerase family protein [Aquirhabdus sp.]
MTVNATQNLVSTTQQGRVLTITLSNPPANFLTFAIMKQLNVLLLELEDRNDIGAVIITSALDGVFLTHFDVDEIDQAVAAIPFPMSNLMTQALTKTETVLSQLPGARPIMRHTAMSGVTDVNFFHEVTARMRGMDKVFIAAINGRAMGGGCELALACDLRIMIEGDEETGSVIGQPEILIGLIPGGGGTQMLVRNLGVARAMEHLLEGRPITPARALELGLVNHVVPAADLMSEALLLAERMARRSPQAVRATKNSVYQGGSLPLNQGIDREKSEFLSAASQPNTRRAMGTYTTKTSIFLPAVLQLFKPKIHNDAWQSFKKAQYLCRIMYIMLNNIIAISIILKRDDS